MTQRIMGYMGEPIPLYQTGTLNFARHLDGKTFYELAHDYAALATVEEDIERQAYRAAADQSLTVLRLVKKSWTVTPNGQVYNVSLQVRHEPQDDDKLIHDVAYRIARAPEIWYPVPNHAAIAQAAVRAVRDLGRLSAASPRPDGIPE